MTILLHLLWLLLLTVRMQLCYTKRPKTQIKSSSDYKISPNEYNSSANITIFLSQDGYQVPIGFNKTVYMLWFQGFDAAPEVVQKCKQSWVHYNPTWNIVLLDNVTLSHYISNDTMNRLLPRRANMIPAHVADIIRLILIGRYGGIWADATIFCNRPLDEWIYTNITQGFFAFYKPAPTRLVSNWFLYGSRGNYIVQTWANATIHHHATHNEVYQAVHSKTDNDYFIQHTLFKKLYTEDPIFHKIWDAVPKLGASRNGPHLLIENGLFKRVSSKVKEAISLKLSPIYKLSWKDYVSDRKSMTNIDYLFSTISTNSSNHN